MSKNRNSQSKYTGPTNVGTPVDVLAAKTFVGKSADLVIFDEFPTESENLQPTMEQIGIVIPALLNIRSQPIVDPANIVGTILKDTEVLIESTDGEFYKIITKPGDDGYCMKKFIRIRGEGVG